jgi:ribosomal protein S19E (S16A)
MVFFLAPDIKSRQAEVVQTDPKLEKELVGEINEYGRIKRSKRGSTVSSKGRKVNKLLILDN